MWLCVAATSKEIQVGCTSPHATTTRSMACGACRCPSAVSHPPCCVTSTTSAGPMGVSSSSPIECTTSAFFTPSRCRGGWGVGGGGLVRQACQACQAPRQPGVRPHCQHTRQAAAQVRRRIGPPQGRTHPPRPALRTDPHHTIHTHTTQRAAHLQRVGHQVADCGGVDPHQAVLGICRVEHGAQQVEGGAHLERLAHRHHRLWYGGGRLGEARKGEGVIWPARGVGGLQQQKRAAGRGARAAGRRGGQHGG